MGGGWVTEWLDGPFFTPHSPHVLTLPIQFIAFIWHVFLSTSHVPGTGKTYGKSVGVPNLNELRVSKGERHTSTSCGGD